MCQLTALDRSAGQVAIAGVQLAGAAVVDLEDLRVAVDTGNHRVGRGQLAELRGERSMLLRVEVLTREEHHLVPQPRRHGSRRTCRDRSGCFRSTPRISAPMAPDSGRMPSAGAVSWRLAAGPVVSVSGYVVIVVMVSFQAAGRVNIRTRQCRLNKSELPNASIPRTDSARRGDRHGRRLDLHSHQRQLPERCGGRRRDHV